MKGTEPFTQQFEGLALSKAEGRIAEHKMRAARRTPALVVVVDCDPSFRAVSSDVVLHFDSSRDPITITYRRGLADDSRLQL